MGLFDKKEDDELQPDMTSTLQAPMPDVRSYIEDLYAKRGLGDDKRAQLEESIDSSRPGGVTTFLASLGAGLAGQDQNAAVKQLNSGVDRKRKELEGFDKKRESAYKDVEKNKFIAKADRENVYDMQSNDPNSERSRLMQDIASRMFPGRDFSNIPGKQLDKIMPQLKSIMDQELEADIRKNDREFKNEDRQFKRQLDTQKIDLAKEKADPRIQGMKAVDRDFAKEYNEWTSGGAGTARLELDKLKGVTNKLKEKKVTTGGLTGAFSDRFITDNDVLAARADVRSTVMNSLRAILGAQFTEKEGTMIISNTWNEVDSTENNLERLNRLVEDLENRANQKDRKVKFYGTNGTLAGFNVDQSSNEKSQGMPGKVVITNGEETLTLDASEKEAIKEALSEGFKVVE